MAYGKNVFFGSAVFGVDGWFCLIVIGKRQPYLLQNAVDAVASEMRFTVYKVWNHSLGTYYPEKVGPFPEKAQASNALQEINDYYMHLLSCLKKNCKPLDYPKWKKYLDLYKKASQ